MISSGSFEGTNATFNFSIVLFPESSLVWSCADVSAPVVSDELPQPARRDTPSKQNVKTSVALRGKTRKHSVNFDIILPFNIINVPRDVLKNAKIFHLPSQALPAPVPLRSAYEADT